MSRQKTMKKYARQEDKTDTQDSSRLYFWVYVYEMTGLSFFTN